MQKPWKKNIPFSLGKAYGGAGRWGLCWHYSRESQAFITITVINHGWLTITLHNFNYAPGGVPNSIDLFNWLQSEVKTLLICPCGRFLLSVWTVFQRELEMVMREVNLKEKDKYCILMHISGIWKNWWLSRWSYLQSRNRDTDIENKCMDTKGGKEGGGRNWEIHTYTTMYKIDATLDLSQKAMRQRIK